MKNRIVTLLAAIALCAVALVASPAQAAVSPSATSAGKWLAGQLTGGLIHNAQYNFDDYGLTLDVLFALQAADTQGAKQDAIVSAMRKNIKKYIYNFPNEEPANGVYAGSAAKALVAVQAAEKNAKSFGTFGPDKDKKAIDLVKTVEDTIEPSGADKGRLKDRGIANWEDPTKFDDYSNLLYQAYGLEGLAEAKSDQVGIVRDYLLDQQCGPGYFSLYFGDCKTDTDATAHAIRAMSAAKADGVTGLGGALNKATAWLVKAQRSDGSFGGGESTPESNTNSTGIAASVLAMRGKTTAAEKAAAWIFKLQVKASTGGKLKGERGAVAYIKDSFDDGRKNGISETTTDQWRRATAQAALGLIHLDPDTIDTKLIEKVVTKVPKPLVRTMTRVSAPVVVSNPAPVADKADSAPGRLGQYLAGQFSNGDHIEVKEGDGTFTDYDLTADAILGLRQLGQQPSFAERASTFLLADGSVDAYAHGAPYEKDASYADALAKLVIAGSMTKKPDTKALKALTSELAGLQQDDGTFQDDGKYADESGDTKRHSLAALALLMAGDTEGAHQAVTYLADGQCEDGSFPAELGSACETGDPAATGWALQALNAISKDARAGTTTLAELPSGWSKDRVDTVVDAATSLNSVVRVNGSLDVVGADNAALAAVAIGRQASGLDARSTALFLAGLQKGDGGLPALSGDKKSDPKASIAVAPALAPASLLSTPGTRLTTALALPMAHTESSSLKAPARTSGDDDELTITKPVAYAGGGALALLVMAAGALALLGRKRVAA